MSTYLQDPILHTMHNQSGLSVTVMDFGATMLDISLKLDNNETRHLLVKPKHLCDFAHQSSYLHATIGRYANRIANSTFNINGKQYYLSSNALHCLHGGVEGFDKRRFSFIEKNDNSCVLQLESSDGDQGFPGNVVLQVSFLLENDNTMRINYYLTTDKDTYASITNHAYFNLNGTNSSILDHSLYLDSEQILELDENNVPTGKVLDLNNNQAFDFRQVKTIGADFLNHPQMIQARGYDHPYLIKGDLNTPFAKVCSDDHKVSVSVATDYPCCQFYTANYLNSSTSVKDDNDVVYDNQHAFCLEPGFCPDGPNLACHKAPLITKDKPLNKTIIYKFSCN